MAQGTSMPQMCVFVKGVDNLPYKTVISSYFMILCDRRIQNSKEVSNCYGNLLPQRGLTDDKVARILTLWWIAEGLP